MSIKLKSKSLGGFDEVMKMIDDMVVLLGKQTAEDEKQKAWCEGEFEKAADEEAASKTKLGQTDAELAEATEMRKEQHAEYVSAMQLNEVAVGLVEKAKNRMQKFYNPTLYKAAPKTERTMEQKIIDAGTFAQVNSHFVSKDLTFGKYQKSEKASGVMGLMDMITKELAADAKDAGFEEKTAQTDYAELMSAAQASRASDTKSIVDKNAAKATVEEKLMSTKKSRTLTTEELDMISSYIGDLHVSCDFIMQ